MFEGSSEVIESARPTWDAPRDWRMVDRKLRAIAKQRGLLDAEEARWLREAERLEIWRPLGMVSALDYLERVLGYTPHAARERLRVAHALADLPAIAESFAQGELPFSAVRELTRVATGDTDVAWRDAAVGKSVREIEEAVAGRVRGSAPDDPPDPVVRDHFVGLKLRPDVYARYRQACATLADEHGQYLDDNELMAAFCDGVERAARATEPTGRAKYQVAMTICARCKQGWQHGAGVKLPVDDAAVEQALCDAQHIGSIDAEVPARAHQDIPPATVRLVWHRDGGRCQTPGCRSSRGLEIHHIVRRADGGGHEPSNLSVRCGACYRAHHEGKLTITGTAPDRLQTHRRNGPNPPSRSDEATAQPTGDAHRDPVPRLDETGAQPAADDVHRDPGSKLGGAIMRTQTRDVLVGLGWKASIARNAVDAAASHVGRGADLNAWVREALRHCPLPPGVRVT